MPGTLIRRAREAAGMNQAELGALVAPEHPVRFQTVSKWERDETVPRPRLARRLDDALELHGELMRRLGYQPVEDDEPAGPSLAGMDAKLDRLLSGVDRAVSQRDELADSIARGAAALTEALRLLHLLTSEFDDRVERGGRPSPPRGRPLPRGGGAKGRRNVRGGC
jgi:transcriptional regulator with XRE-family HTH domain